MNYEESYGVIPVRFTDDGAELLLVQLHAGHWNFPKGHAEEGESPWETAVRELEEETCLSVQKRFGDVFFDEHYVFEKDGAQMSKRVRYYPAVVSGDVVVQPEEISAAGWFSLDTVVDRVTFPEAKALCRKVVSWLSGL